MTCEFQIADGVLVTAVNTLKYINNVVSQPGMQLKYTLSEQHILPLNKGTVSHVCDDETYFFKHSSSLN